MLKMIDRNCVKLDSKLRCADRTKLVCMNFRDEAEPLCFKKNLFGLMKVEISLIAEDIAEDRKLTLADVRQHFIRDEFNVPVSVLGELRRESMRAKKSRNYRHVVIPAEIVQNVEHLCFCVNTQAVAAFNFDRRRSKLHHLVEPASGGSKQLFFCCCARGIHRGENSASCVCNLRI